MKHLLTTYAIIVALIAGVVVLSFTTSYLSRVTYLQEMTIWELKQDIIKWKAIVEAQADGSFRLFIEPISPKEY